MWRNPCTVLHGAQSWRSASVRLGWVQLGSVQLRFFVFFFFFCHSLEVNVKHRLATASATEVNRHVPMLLAQNMWLVVVTVVVVVVVVACCGFIIYVGKQTLLALGG